MSELSVGEKVEQVRVFSSVWIEGHPQGSVGELYNHLQRCGDQLQHDIDTHGDAPAREAVERLQEPVRSELRQWCEREESRSVSLAECLRLLTERQNVLGTVSSRSADQTKVADALNNG